MDLLFSEKLLAICEKDESFHTSNKTQKCSQLLSGIKLFTPLDRFLNLLFSEKLLAICEENESCRTSNKTQKCSQLLR